MLNLMVKEFNKVPVRIITLDGEPWWVASDVCDVLDLSNPTEALRPLDEDEKNTLRISEGGPENNIINEAGLYTLIMRSNKPQAREFRRWVTHEVLPEIRRTGGYALPRTLPEALRALADHTEATERLERDRQSLEAQNAKLSPLAELYQKLVETEGLYEWNEAAKVLYNRFPYIGRTRLLAMLRERGYLRPNRTEPYHRYIEQGLFKLKLLTYKDSEGVERTTTKTLCTMKGMDALARVLSGQVLEPAVEIKPSETLDQILDSIRDRELYPS